MKTLPDGDLDKQQLKAFRGTSIPTTASTFAIQPERVSMYLRLVRLSRAGQPMMARSDATTAGTNNFGIFPYNQISPFGFNGAFYYGRLTLGF